MKNQTILVNIFENAINGNWTDARKEIKDNFISTKELIEYYEENLEECSYFKGSDIAYLVD